MSTAETTTAYLPDGRYIKVPDDYVDDWRDEVRNESTTLGLADWYTNQGDDKQDEIQGEADDDTRCDHDELTHRVTNESQIGGYQKDKPIRAARVCRRRACILDAMAWVERGTGERSAWAGPGQEFSFDMPEHLPDGEPGE